MGENSAGKSVILGKRVFLYLMGVTLLCVISLGFFWVEGKVVRYRKDVHQLKQTYSDDKKQEIKNKILEIKDYIIWIQYSSKKPIAYTLSNQIESLNLKDIHAGADLLSGKIPQAVIDSINRSRVPVYVINSKGSIVYSFNPFSETGEIESDSEKKALLNQIRGRTSEEKGIISVIRPSGKNDSTLIAAGYFNNVILPGFSVVSVVGPEDIIDVLQVHLCDSISKLRFEENEYVFINTMDGKALVTHGRYNNPPKNILATGDTAWVDVFRAEQSSALHPEGVFHKYTWPLLVRPGTSGKTSYFSYIPSFDWIIGMGFYEDDVIKEIIIRKKELYEDLKKTILNIAFFLLISTVLCFILVKFFSRRLGKNIEIFNTFFEKAAKENLSIDTSKVGYREFMFMAEAANLMVEERRQIEDALKESELHYRYLFEQNPVPLLIYDLEDMKLLSVNEAFTVHYGYSAEEAMNMRLTDLCVEEERALAEDLIKRLKGLAYIGEWHHIKKDGTPITVEINSHGFLQEGHSSRIAVISDITNRKKAEEEIRNLNANLEMKVDERTSLLESANKELEAFSYSVSHDLRAPLRHVNGFLELLIKSHYQQMDERGKHYIESISKASNHMGILIDNLLNFSRTGRMEMKLDVIDMNQVIKDALSILEQETDGRNIEWKLVNMPEVYADYAMMRQVWVNLFSNAIKYTRKRETAVIEVGSITEANENIFFVRDNGTGFDMNYSGKLFGVFQRLHTSDEFEGTGIGLANVRQVIKRHRGRTWAEGEVDKGATFYFSLPKTNTKP